MKRNIIAIYPRYAINGLRQIGGASWHNLIDRVVTLPSTQPEALAFTLMMRRVRALCGRADEQCDDLACAMCASDLLTNYGGSEADLLDEFYRTLDEVKGFLARQPILAHKAA